MSAPAPNRPFKGDPVNFEALKEPWSEYLLDDGKILRVKLVLLKVIRNPGELTPEGNPVYGVMTNTVVAVFSPGEMPKTGAKHE